MKEKNNEPYFHRNVMQKIEVTKVSETLNERAKKITGKIFVDDKDLDFLDYIRDEHINSLSAKEKAYFNRDKERNIIILSLFLGTGIRVNELSNLRIKDIDFSSGEISVIRKVIKRILFQLLLPALLIYKIILLWDKKNIKPVMVKMSSYSLNFLGVRRSH